MTIDWNRPPGASAAADTPADGICLPRITIAAFSETAAAAAVLATMAADRRMARTRFAVNEGGSREALRQYHDVASPDLILLQTDAAADELLAELGALADACDSRTKIVVIGSSNDIALYRELVSRGVSEYIVGPVTAQALIASVAHIYRDVDAKPLGRTYAFIGARGGVGSSTMAHNVAATIARTCATQAIIADLDLPFGTAGLDFNVQPAQNLAEAIQDSGHLDELVIERLLTDCGDGLSLLAAPATLARAYDLDEKVIDQVVEVARRSAPHLVLDLPHLWTSWVRSLITAADAVVITASPDLASLRNTKSLLEVLAQLRPNDAPPEILLNQVGVPKRPEIKAKDFADAIGLSPFAAIPFDPWLFGRAAQNGQMIAEVKANARACAAFTELARSLVGHEGATGYAEQRPSLLHRLGLIGPRRQAAPA